MIRLPRSGRGKAVARGGLGITTLGIAGLTSWQPENIRVAQIGAPFEMGGRILTRDKVEDVQDPNSPCTEGVFALARDGREISQRRPEKRVYPVAQMPTTEAAIDQNLAHDVYVVIEDAQGNGGWAIRVCIKPLIHWMWIVCGPMALGAGFR